ncbi:hypothetical protein [Crateriforma conspicua]|uniref:hypothetical protein n=1 Tax=Crateriforma conspicua TaxID=2527996 RepID=UPI0036F41754
MRSNRRVRWVDAVSPKWILSWNVDTLFGGASDGQTGGLRRSGIRSAKSRPIGRIKPVRIQSPPHRFFQRFAAPKTLCRPQYKNFSVSPFA